MPLMSLFMTVAVAAVSLLGLMAPPHLFVLLKANSLLLAVSDAAPRAARRRWSAVRWERLTERLSVARLSDARKRLRSATAPHGFLTTTWRAWTAMRSSEALRARVIAVVGTALVCLTSADRDDVAVTGLAAVLALAAPPAVSAATTDKTTIRATPRCDAADDMPYPSPF